MPLRALSRQYAPAAKVILAADGILPPRLPFLAAKKMEPTMQMTYEDDLQAAWEKLMAGDDAEALPIFRRHAGEDVVPLEAELGLLALRLKDSEPAVLLDELLRGVARQPSCRRIWLYIEQLAASINPEISAAARQCAQALARP